MTIQSQTSSISYTGNSVTTVFAYNFKTTDQTWLQIYVDGVLKTLTTDYSVSGVGSASGGNITFVTAPSNGSAVYIARSNVPATQLVDYTANDSFPADTHESALDKLTMLVQSLVSSISKTIKLTNSETSTTAKTTLASVVSRAKRLLFFNSAGELDYTSNPPNTVLAFDEFGNVAYETLPQGTPIGTFLQTGSGAVERTYQNKVREHVSILDFGAVGDGVADCYDAFMKAIAANTYGSGYYISAGTILIPPGTYYVSQTINLKKQVKFIGCGGAKGYSYAPIIKFAAGVHGFIVHRYNTNEAGIETTPTTAADGSIFDGLQITSASNAIGIFHGIWMRAAAVIRDTYVWNFSGHNIYANAAAGGGGLIEGNANNWFMENVRSAFSGQCGIYIRGADANAGNGIALDVANNTEYGIADYSFLGNTYSGCHSAENGTSTTKRAWVNYGGRIYLCIDSTLGSTTTPGTNGAVWYDYAATAGADQWVSGNTYVQGGAYAGIGASARNMFINCYSEGGQPPSYFSGSSQQIFSGLHAAGVAGGSIFRGTIGGFSAASFTSTSSKVIVETTLSNQDVALAIRTPDSTNPKWSLKLNSTTDLGLKFDYANGPVAYQILGPNTTEQMGTSTIKPYYFIPTKFSLPILSGGQRRQLTGTSAPASLEWAVGDIIFNTNPASGMYIGWVCTVAGTPGTWNTFGLIS